MPSESLRKLEIDANHAFDQYRDMYFEGGVSSVYLWDLDHGFAGKIKSLSDYFWMNLSKCSQKRFASDIVFLIFYINELKRGQKLFAGVILIKKAGDGSKKIKGCWDSIHVFEVQEKPGGRSAHYKLTSTAMLWLQTNKQGSGTMNLGGSLTRQVI